ncbi:hypothetical protein BGZ67_000800 [Mortierella alpina]|nr:hypothetical protein BGZ67_000800 [Mortierella alpina]
MSASTRRQYLTALEAFKSFCDDTYAADGRSRYEVYEDKVLVYFQDVLFQRTVEKTFKNVKELARANVPVCFKSSQAIPVDPETDAGIANSSY